MNRLVRAVLLFAVAALVSFAASTRTRAQESAVPPGKQDAAKQELPKQDADKKESEEEENPFAPQPAPPLPAGMSGSDANDPRAKLAPGIYDAGEAAMGIKHVLLVKKPDAFQLGTTEAEDPKVQKMLGQLGIGNPAKMAKELQLVVAQLAFANSDLAFQGLDLQGFTRGYPVLFTTRFNDCIHRMTPFKW